MVQGRNFRFPYLNRGESDFINSKLVKTQPPKVTPNQDLAPLCPPGKGPYPPEDFSEPQKPSFLENF